MSRKLALIIGNSEYQDARLARLATPGEDIGNLAEVLRAPEIGGFDEVTTLSNEPAAATLRAIARFFAQKKPDDLLVLYFSGHGVRDDQGFLHLAVKDTEHDLLSGSAIPAAFITGEMDRSRSRRQVLILDCCHSGAFAQGMKGITGGSVGTGPAFEGTGYGRVVLTATDSTQYAWEGDQVIGEAENSVFTHYLIQGLQTGAADLDRDGWISLDELYDYIYEQIVSRTPRQTPGKWSYKQQGEIILARNPRPLPQPVVAQSDTRPRVAPTSYAVVQREVKESSKKEVGSSKKEEVGPVSIAKSEVLQRPAPLGTNWSSIAQKAVGWGMAWGLGWGIAWFILILILSATGGNLEGGEIIAGLIGGGLGGGVGGLLAGAVTLLLLRRAEPRIHWNQIWTAAIGWALGGPMSAFIFGGMCVLIGAGVDVSSGSQTPADLGQAIGQAFAQGLAQGIVLVFFAFLGALLGWMVVGLIGGWRAGQEARRTDPTIGWTRIMVVAVSWSLSALVAAVTSLIVMVMLGNALTGN